MRNRDLVEPVYDETLGPSPEQLQDSYISSGLPYDSPPPSYRSSRARNETALNGGSADRSELALRRYAHDEAMPDTYRADAYTPRQQTRQIQDARNAVWPSRSGARSVRFPGLQQPSHFWNNSMPPVPDPEPFTPCVTEDNASRSRRVSDYDYEMGFSAEYSDHRSVEYYTEASYRRAEYYPAPYLDTSTTDWDADPAAVEDVTAYEHSGQMDAESPDILPEKRASDAQCLEHNEAFSHSQVSAVTSQYPLQPVRAAEHVTQSAREQGEGSKSLIDMASTPKPNARVSPSVCQDSTGHTHSSTSNWKSDSSPQEELRQGQECGTSKQPTDGDLATATPSAASKNSVSSNQPSTTMHSPSEGNNAAPSAVWESLFTKSKSTAGGEGTASASGTPGGVWDSLFDDAACSGTKHVNRPQDHSGSAAERRRAQDTEPEEAQQSQGIANSSSPAAAVPSIQPERFSAAELDNHESSFTTGSDSLPVGSVASPKERTQDEYAPRAHASSIIQAATNCANKHKAQYQDPRQHASAVGGEDAGTLHFDAHPVHSKPSGKMQDSVSTATDSTSRVVSAAEYSHDQAKISSAQRHPGRHSAVYTAAGAAGASLFLLQSLAPQERTTTQQITSTKGNVADSADAPETEVSLAAEENTPREEEQVLQSTAVSDVLEASSSFAEQGTSSPFASTSSALAPDAAFISRSAAPDEVCSHRENTSTRDILVTADPVLEPEVAEVLPEEGKMVLVTPQMQAPKIQSRYNPFPGQSTVILLQTVHRFLCVYVSFPKSADSLSVVLLWYKFRSIGVCTADTVVALSVGAH